jgi:GTPase SAR1 family protein
VVKKKIGMLGSFGVGKTSLVARFVHSMFSDKYHTTVGVKIDKKIVRVDGSEVTLMLWDMAGEEANTPVKIHQIRDAAGYLLVVDGCRSPFLLLANKADERSNWEIPDSTWQQLKERGWTVLETSAKTGQQVEEAFLTLTGRILKAQHERQDSEEDD